MLGTIVILFTIITVLIIFVFGNRINIIMEESFPKISHISNYILNLRNIIIIISLFIIFVFIYKFIPNKEGNRIKTQIPGALFASIRLDCCFILFLNIY